MTDGPRTCDMCKSEVSADARKCEQCGEKLKKPLSRGVKIAVPVILGLFVLMFGIYFAVRPGPGDEPVSESVAGFTACEHGRIVLSDISSGDLRELEMVEELKVLMEETKFAEPAIADSGLRMVQAVVTGDFDGFSSAGQSFFDACARAGY